jgi:hypothetical protein
MGRGLKRLAASTALLALLITAVPAFGAEISRDEYRAKVEPICKTNVEANEKILGGVKAKVKSGKLAAASKQFASAAKALKKARTQILAVPQPTADVARLTKWLGYVKEEVQLFEGVSRKLAAGQKTAAQKLVVRLTSNANKANNEVLPMEFHYCRFEPSKFT